MCVIPWGRRFDSAGGRHKPTRETYMEKKKTKKEIMRSLIDGAELKIPLEGESYGAWTQRSRELNREDGWHHYDISRNERFNELRIIARMPAVKTGG